MYHYLGTGLGNWKDLKDKKVLEIGSGRGGGLEYMCKYLGCSEGTGADFSYNQI